MADLSNNQSDLICKALVQASNAVPEIVGELHTLFHYGRDMSPVRRDRIIREARSFTEKLLVAILAAERAMASHASQSNVVTIGGGDNAYADVLDAVAGQMIGSV